MKEENKKSFTDFVSNAMEDSTSSNNSSFEDIFKNSDVLFPIDKEYKNNSIRSRESDNNVYEEEDKNNEVENLFSVASQEENQEEIEESKDNEVKDLFSVASQEENQDEVEESKDNEVKDLFSVASQEENQEEVEESKDSEVKDLFSVASQEENQEEDKESKGSEVKDLFSVASQEENQEEIEESKDNEDKSNLPDESLNTVENGVEATDGNNLFFDINQEEDTVQDINHLVQQNQPQESILNNDSLVQDVESSPVVSDNPFFSDESLDTSQESDSNPLFLNSLNLMENVNQDRTVSGIDVTKSKNYNVKIVKKKEPLFKVIIGIISYAIFIWLLLVGIVLVIYVLDIKIRQSKGDYSAPTYNAYVVLTGSMLPEIQVYDVVVTKKVDAASLKVGDVITFASADTRFLGTIITHRILKKNYDAEKKIYTFQTKGDNNNVADSALVPQSNIFGKVIVKIPKLGYLQEFLAADGGWIIVILIPCLAVISYDIVKLAKGLKKKKYKNIKVQK